MEFLRERDSNCLGQIAGINVKHLIIKWTVVPYSTLLVFHQKNNLKHGWKLSSTGSLNALMPQSFFLRTQER